MAYPGFEAAASGESRQYTSLFNPDEFQSNQEAQYAATGRVASYSEFGDDERTENDEGISEGRSYRGDDERTPYVRDTDALDDTYGQSSSPDGMGESSSRPNKFQGPPSTWRGWTKRERHDVIALDTIRSRDLSIHLYNAFILKKRAKEDKARTIADMTPCGTPDEKPPESLSSFAPNRGWTAWPMPTDEVPRVDERVNRDPDDVWTLRMPPDDRPSAELEECLIAHMMKVSRERFNARPWDWQGARRFEREEPPSESDNQSTAPRDESEFGGLGLSKPTLRPTVQTDDDKSRRLLRPEARNILNKLDDLLLNLEGARKTCASMTQGSINEPKSPTEIARRGTSQSSIDIPPNYKNNPDVETEIWDENDAERSIASKPISSTPESSIDDLEDTLPANPNSQHKGSVRRGLRDWSVVVGMASLAGWPAAAVMRASRRCADLFGEDQVFRTMHEGTVQLNRGEDGMPYWKHTELDEPEEEFQEVEDRPLSSCAENPKEDARYCPVEGCSRRLKGFSRAWNLNQHLKNAHSDLLAESKIQLVKRVYNK
ncbi:uncharacterized protein GIQ15_03282 [Arthroderma uncinatum]|uniref:uncharacterized protein n=1 Tax=Arthroderma uncinatum TaxID=74035 RepID=UPI00144AEBB8|nr:uncharacterized protein GIQ15_03282 [Arthroderma uncinatum]KAF3483958.1 hypothetical protein GIQ15_03282 [Arthroderma uncinatum]